MLDQFLLVVGSQIAVDDVLFVLLVFELFDHNFKRLMIFAFALLHAQNDVAVHLDKAAVAVPRESLVLRCSDERQNGLIVKSEIQNRVHHARHGVASPGTNGNKQRHALGITELATHDLFHVLDASFHLALKFLRVGLLVRVEVGAYFGRDGESGRHWEVDAGHFREIRALAAEQRLH